jgi:hypothetical protein
MMVPLDAGARHAGQQLLHNRVQRRGPQREPWLTLPLGLP